MAYIEDARYVAEDGIWFDRLERQIRDYIANTRNLIWQRQAIFFAATILAACYFSPAVAFAFYGAVLFTEVVDLAIARRVESWSGQDGDRSRRFMPWIIGNTVLSSAAICLFVTSIALQQEPGNHFTPLFFLFAAGVFAAMNNHQLMPALAVRLSIYGLTFIAIALMDILREMPPLSSVLWLHFFTVIFVLYFIVDCSLVFLQMYQRNLNQLEEMTLEHQRTKEAYRVKSEFVSTVSHELRTPLTSIKGSLDLVTSGALGPLPEKMAPILGIACKNSARLAALINDILDLQKIEAGEIQYRFAPVEVGALVQEAVDANRGYADAHQVELECQANADEDVWIRGDETRLMQVMANIISNAIKFSHEGGTVRVRYRRFYDKVRIYVDDEGIGIPPGQKEKVFDQFSQIDSGDQRKAGGTGLGMKITKQIIEHHGGTIDYVSEQGCGTTFYIELQVEPAP